MDIFNILETFGVPVAMSVAFGFFIWKQNKFIQDELMEEIDERFKREESILINPIEYVNDFYDDPEGKVHPLFYPKERYEIAHHLTKNTLKTKYFLDKGKWDAEQVQEAYSSKIQVSSLFCAAITSNNPYSDRWNINDMEEEVRSTYTELNQNQIMLLENGESISTVDATGGTAEVKDFLLYLITFIASTVG